MYLEDASRNCVKRLFVWPNLLRHLHSSVPALVLTVLLAAIEQQS